MNYSRREIMRGLSLGAGSALLSPLMRHVQLQADGRGDLFPSRFVFVVKSSGIVPEGITPAAFRSAGASPDLVNADLTRVALPESMGALEPFKDQLSIVQGLSGKMCRGGHSSYFGMMAAYMTGGEFDAGTVVRATADAELAKLNPAPFNHVALAVKGKALGKGYGGTMYPGITAVGPGKELPFQGSPDVAYEQLFGSAVSATESGKKRFRLQRNLFDFMVDDLKKVRKEIPSSERGKLDAYLNSFEELQVRHSRLSGMKRQIKEHAPAFSDKFTAEPEELRQEAHFDLAAAALIAGLTNVVTIRLDNINTTYTQLGIDKHNHGIGHDEGTRPQAEYRDIIRKHHSGLLAGLAGKLKAVPEGDGNLLDRTMIVFLSDSGDAHHGSCFQWPYVVVGGCSGKLKLPGRYLRFPEYGEPGCRTIADWWTTVLNAHGNPVGFFGNEDLVLKQNGVSHAGPLTELLA